MVLNNLFWWDDMRQGREFAGRGVRIPDLPRQLPPCLTRIQAMHQHPGPKVPESFFLLIGLSLCQSSPGTRQSVGTALGGGAPA